MSIDYIMKLVVLGLMSLGAVCCYVLTVRWYLQKEYGGAMIICNFGIFLNVPAALVHWGLTGKNWSGILLITFMFFSWVFFGWKAKREDPATCFTCITMILLMLGLLVLKLVSGTPWS